MIQQLRIYELVPGNEAAFFARFRDHAVRIFERHGIEVARSWATDRDGTPEFVYLLEWPDRATMEAAWQSFGADEEWRRIKRETAAAHGEVVVSVSDRVLEPVEVR